MYMLVLAGGFGTRLREVLSDVPKPLAPINGVPFLRYQIENWFNQGVRSFAFLLHHQAEHVKEFLEKNRRELFPGCLVKSIIEPQPLDTGGAVAYAVQRLGLKNEFLVANADTWLGTGVRELSSAGADGLAVAKQPEISRYGQVEFDNAGFVSAFHEKGENNGAGWINAGLCVLQTKHFVAWDGQRLSLEKDIFPELVERRLLRVVPLESDFIDIGIPEDYQRFCRWQSLNRQGGLCI